MSLLHFNGINGSTTFTDEKGLTWTGVSGASLSTSNKKFGSASLYLNGSSYISTPYNTDLTLGNGDFTLETFLYSTDASATFKNIYCPNYASAPSFVFRLTSTHNLNFGVSDDGMGFNLYMTASTPISLSTWHHAAITRSGNDWKIFLDGQIVASTTLAITPFTLSTDYIFGMRNGAQYFTGYIDEFRFTKGVARYTSNFTPPLAEFLNS